MADKAFDQAPRVVEHGLPAVTGRPRLQPGQRWPLAVHSSSGYALVLPVSPVRPGLSSRLGGHLYEVVTLFSSAQGWACSAVQDDVGPDPFVRPGEDVLGVPVRASDHGAQEKDDDGNTKTWAAVVGQAADGIAAVELRSAKAGKRVAITSPWGHFAIVMPTTPNASLSLIAFRADGTSWVQQMDAAHAPSAGEPTDALVAYAIGTGQAGIATAAEVRRLMTDAEEPYGKQLGEP